MQKLFRITTIAASLDKLLQGQLGFMSKYFEVFGVASGEDLLKKISEREDAVTYNIEMTRKITPVQDMKATWQLYKLLKKHKPLIVHSHTPKAGIVAMLAAKLAGVPYRLHTVAGLPLLEATGKKRTLLNWVERFTYSCATGVYPNSFGLKDIIIKEGFCEESKLKVIGQGSSNGIDTLHFSPNEVNAHQRQQLKHELGINESDFVFIFIGRLVSDKGINELIEAFTELHKQFVNTKLVLVGSFESDLDPLKPENERTIHSHSSIYAVGPQYDVRPYLAISDVLAFPSYREGFPNVVMQAGAMGLPAIVSDINGCNEIVEEGKNGTIIPVKDSGALRTAMERMITDRKALEIMKGNARPMICGRYEQSIIWNELLKEYQSLERGTAS